MANPKVVILSGVSGAGKTSYALRLEYEARAACMMPGGARVSRVSADDYFLEGRRYEFDASKLGDAHGWCFRRFIRAVGDDNYRATLVIVDNTNTSVEELAPYVLGATAYWYDVEIHTLTGAPLADCVARNVHGVSAETIERQAQRLSTRKLPPWWKNIEVVL